jgi:phage tail sheath gpL-like
MTTVPFNTIASGIRTNTHHTEFDSSRAVAGALTRHHKILVIGRRLATGTVEEFELKRVLSADQGESFHGVGSELAEMIRAAKKANAQTEMWSIGAAPLAGGTAGTKTITVTGTATADKTIHLYIAGRFYVPVAIAGGDLENAIATKINTAIQAHREYARMPFTSDVATSVVTVTMKWKGVDVADVRTNYNPSDENVPGVTVEIEAGVAGAGNPDVGEVIAAWGDTTQWDTIVMPWTDATNLGLLETELLSRWGGMRQIDGHAFAAVFGSHGTASTLGSSRNSKHLTIMGANLSPTPPWIWAAVVGAVDAFEPDPARPRQTLPLPGVLAAKPTELWGDADRNLLLFDGISTHVVDQGGNVTIERLITTHQTNAQGVPDAAYLDVETIRTLSAIRYDGNSAVSLAFPRCKLAKDGVDLPAGQPIVTPNVMRAFLGGRYANVWAALGWVEGAALKQFMEELIVGIDDSDPNRLVAQGGPDLMNQFRGMSTQWQFIV